MENNTVRELREIAKERKIRYYYRMRKADLIRALQPVRSILDEPIPLSSSSPVLAPEPRLSSTLETAVRSVASYVSNTFNKLLERIDPYVPEPIKKKVRSARDGVEKRIKSLKDIAFGKPPIEFQLSNHAIKRSVKQFSYEVENEERDVSSFLDRAREGVKKILRENRNKKVNLVLTCEMSRVSILTGEEAIQIAGFHSRSRIVLEATDLEKLYDSERIHPGKNCQL